MKKNKFNIPLAKPWFTSREPEAAYKVVKSGWLISGPKVEEFEERFSKLIGAKYAIAVDTGSSALLVALAALGVGSGDEVIAPNMTFVSSASSCMYLGARPVPVDINLRNYCIDPYRIKNKITKRTKVIIPVHYAGQTADMDEITRIARKHNLHATQFTKNSFKTPEASSSACGNLLALPFGFFLLHGVSFAIGGVGPLCFVHPADTHLHWGGTKAYKTWSFI